MDTALLDTDTLSEVFKLRDPTVRQKALDYARAHGQLAFSSMTWYEVLRGLRDQIRRHNSSASRSSVSTR